MFEGLYENVSRVVYGDGMTFIPVCKVCSRFVKAPESVKTYCFGEMLSDEPNCTYSKCGVSHMIFEGWF